MQFLLINYDKLRTSKILFYSLKNDNHTKIIYLFIKI